MKTEAEAHSEERPAPDGEVEARNRLDGIFFISRRRCSAKNREKIAEADVRRP